MIEQEGGPSENRVMAYIQRGTVFPTFKGVWIISDTYPRTERVSPNPFTSEDQWSIPETNPEFWAPCCEPDGSVRVLTPGKRTCCRMCPETWSEELLPCAWCKGWAHYRCTYGIEEGRACASHFLVLDPLNKAIIANPRDECVPMAWKGRFSRTVVAQG